jgi:putative ABC transport system permease protein
MRLTQSIKTAAVGLLAHKSRTALTILGIVIGISAIMLIASVGGAAENLILGQIESLGTNIVAVVPGKEPTGPTDPAVTESLFSDSLKQRDLDALNDKSNVPHAADIMPVVFGVESVSYEGETFRPLILGSSGLVADFFDLETEEGLFFAEEDIQSRAGVAVIGSEVKKELFGESSPIGEKIRVNDRNLRVVGTLPPKGQVLFFNFDETIIIPYTTAQQYVFGIKHFNRIIIQAESEQYVEKTAIDAELTLRELHNITDPDDDDFFVETQEGLSDTLGAVTSAITLFLGAVAAIALVVGGIGIMNIMLVSITERTREIGLRKAIGATNRNILMQFLSEAVLLTTIGGAIGILIGTLLSVATSIILTFVMKTPWPFSFPLSAAILGLTVSVLVGLIFGIYPARKASLKNPIEALSYE